MWRRGSHHVGVGTLVVLCMLLAMLGAVSSSVQTKVWVDCGLSGRGRHNEKTGERVQPRRVEKRRGMHTLVSVYSVRERERGDTQHEEGIDSRGSTRERFADRKKNVLDLIIYRRLIPERHMGRGVVQL